MRRATTWIFCSKHSVIKQIVGKKVKKEAYLKDSQILPFFPTADDEDDEDENGEIPPIIITIWEQKAGGGVIRPTFGTSRRRRTRATKRR